MSETLKTTAAFAAIGFVLVVGMTKAMHWQNEKRMQKLFGNHIYVEKAEPPTRDRGKFASMY